MNDLEVDFLLQCAEKYIWWKEPDQALEYKDRLIAQIMDIGVWEDICSLIRLCGEDELKRVLSVAQAGWLRPRSWHYWHYRLYESDVVVPDMPTRKFA